MRQFIIVSLLCAGLAGCATVPDPTPPADLVLASDVEGGVDEVWPRLVAFLMELGATVATSDRAGGLLTTEWKALPPDVANEWINCGLNVITKQPFTFDRRLTGWMRMQVQMRETPRGTHIALRPEYAAYWAGTSVSQGPAEPNSERGRFSTNCVTTGQLERALLAAAAGP